jgi:archaellum component FlaC
MPTIEDVRNTLEGIREKLERLRNETDDRRMTTPEILREFAYFRESVLDEIIGYLEDAEEKLLEIEEENE